MANITTISLDDTGYDTVAVLNANFAALNAASISKYVAALADAVGEVTITHNLGSVDVVVSAFDATGKQVYADVVAYSTNVIKITFETAFIGRVVVIA